MSDKTCRVTLTESDVEMISDALKAHATTLMKKQETAMKGMECIQVVGKLDYVLTTSRGPRNVTENNSSDTGTNANTDTSS